MRQWLMIMFCCFCGLSVSGMAVATVKTLRLAHNHNRQHPVHQAMMYMADRVQVLTDGQLRIRIYAGGVLGSQRETTEQLQLGALDMVKTSASELEAFDPVYRLFSYAYLFRNQQHLRRILAGEVGRDILAGSSKRGFKGLTYYDSGARHFYARKAIARVEDLHGLKVRVQPSRTLIQMVLAMGGLPTPMSYGELYTALQQGVVDVAENNLTSFVVSRHGEAARYYSWSGHTMIPDVLLISTETWEGLSTRQQENLQQSAKESSMKMQVLWDQAQQKNLELAKAAGTVFVEPDRGSFEKAVQPLYKALQKNAPGLFSLVQSIRRDL